jgi:UDP-N-acetylglucosamine 2-epimerase
VDAHNSEIISSIAKYKSNEKLYMIRHMPLEGFIHTMAHCICMISNSSSGIREAASFGVPVINIGHRQVDRERNQNVIDIGDRYEELRPTIEEYMGHRFEKKNIYFKPNCAEQIAAKITQFIGNEERQ